MRPSATEQHTPRACDYLQPLFSTLFLRSIPNRAVFESVVLPLVRTPYARLRYRQHNPLPPLLFIHSGASVRGGNQLLRFRLRSNWQVTLRDAAADKHL